MPFLKNELKVVTVVLLLPSKNNKYNLRVTSTHLCLTKILQTLNVNTVHMKIQEAIYGQFNYYVSMLSMILDSAVSSD